MPGGRTLGALRRSFHYDLPAGLLRVCVIPNRHDPAVNPGGMRAALPTGSSAASAGGRARSSGRAATTHRGLTANALLHADDSGHMASAPTPRTAPRAGASGLADRRNQGDEERLVIHVRAWAELWRQCAARMDGRPRASETDPDLRAGAGVFA